MQILSQDQTKWTQRVSTALFDRPTAELHEDQVKFVVKPIIVSINNLVEKKVLNPVLYMLVDIESG